MKPIIRNKKPVPYQRKYKMQWWTFDASLSKLKTQINPYKDQIKNIYGVPRGGLVIAVALSNYYNIPLITNQKKIDERTLVCDDLSDSGATFLNLLQKYHVTFTACLIVKKDTTNFFPTFFPSTIDGNKWIVFPWEGSR